jgi:hypothetical protein
VLIYDEPDKTWRRINANPNNPAVTGRVDLGSGTTSFGIEPGLNKSDRSVALHASSRHSPTLTGVRRNDDLRNRVRRGIPAFSLVPPEDDRAVVFIGLWGLDLGDDHRQKLSPGATLARSPV